VASANIRIELKEEIIWNVIDIFASGRVVGQEYTACPIGQEEDLDSVA